jgi:hypothetical protein
LNQDGGIVHFLCQSSEPGSLLIKARKKHFTGFKLQCNILPVELEQLNQEQFSAFLQEH